MTMASCMLDREMKTKGPELDCKAGGGFEQVFF